MAPTDVNVTHDERKNNWDYFELKYPFCVAFSKLALMDLLTETVSDL